MGVGAGIAWPISIRVARRPFQSCCLACSRPFLFNSTKWARSRPSAGEAITAATTAVSRKRFIRDPLTRCRYDASRLDGAARLWLRCSFARFELWPFSPFRFTIAQVAAPHQKDLNKDRLVSAALADDDASFELKLRPRFLREFIGQRKVKDNLGVAIEAAKSRGEALDHVLLYGPPGLGKTTLATIIANELGVAYQQSAGPAIQIKGDLTAILTNLTDRQVLFLDEVHRLQPALEEILYSALEDYKLDIIIGQGPSARTHTIDVRPFTFVAATTRAGLLSAPLRSRFGILLRLEFYTNEELKYIVERS